MSYLRRFLWFATKRLLAFTMVFGMLIITFYMAMNTANITILLKDGMALRAQVVMMGKDDQELLKFFEKEFIEVDTALRLGAAGSLPYQNYTITGFDHRLQMEWMWCWPWDDVARADFVESIPKIDGRIKASLRAEAEKNHPDSLNPPDWATSRYRATLVREGGQWKIQSIKLISTNLTSSGQP